MNTLKVSTKIKCDTCGCSMKKTKTIKVDAIEKEEAIKEANNKIKEWESAMKGQSCKVCRSILESM